MSEETILFKGMPNPQDWAWAHCCVRGIKGSYFVTYDDQLANDFWNKAETMPTDERGELDHETWEPIWNKVMLPGLGNFEEHNIVSREMLSEMIPRILLQLQRENSTDMTKSTVFLLSLKDFNSLGSIDQLGWGCFPAKPLKENPVYGGIFLGGLTVADHLGDGDLGSGIKRLIRIAQRCETGDELWSRLETEGVKRKWLLETLEPMREGQRNKLHKALPC